MRPIWKDILLSVFMGLVLPGVLLNFTVLYLDAQEPQAQEEPALALGQEDAYLVGVVLAEMPASFELEALKAQAVAARTYARKVAQSGKHESGAPCTESGCCQAYISQEGYLAQGGTQENLDKVICAVAATSGLVLTYEGELIEATYFSCSGGRTEDAAAVWGAAFPYLQSVSSPGEEKAAHYSDTVVFTPEKFQKALGVTLGGSPQEWFGMVTYTEGGGVETMTIGTQTYSGTQLRSLLGLGSTAFSVTAQDAAITITTQGYGHRVGMSQYGADAMALQGSSFRQILAHYYPGTVVEGR